MQNYKQNYKDRQSQNFMLGNYRGSDKSLITTERNMIESNSQPMLNSSPQTMRIRISVDFNFSGEVMDTAEILNNMVDIVKDYNGTEISWNMYSST